jgi:hypothetical protein
VSDGRTAIEPPPITVERANEAPVGDLIAQMTRERDETVRLIESLDASAFDRVARQQTFGELTVLQWLRSYYRHDRMHLDQIRGEESDYRPNYQPGHSEPRPT